MISMRQLAGRWRILITLALAALPVITVVATTVSHGVSNPSEYDELLLNAFFAAAVLPLIVLGVATAAFGNEVEDKTLANLTLNPVPRWQIVMPKLLAAITVAAPLLLISAAVSVVIAYEGDGRTVLAVLVAITVAIATYSAVFLWLGLMSTQALGIGLLYVFLWEGLFSNFVPGVRLFSIREYMLGVIRGIAPERFASNEAEVLGAGTSFVASAVVIVVFTALSVRRLRTMDVP